MNLEEYIERPVFLIRQDTAVADCLGYMSFPGIHDLVVTDSLGAPLGVFCGPELARAVKSHDNVSGLPVASVMNTGFDVLDANTPFDPKNAVDSDYWIVKRQREIIGVLHRKTVLPRFSKSAPHVLSRMGMFLNSIYNPIIAIDTNGIVIFSNKAMAKVAGIPVSDLVGANIDDIFTDSQLRRIIRTGKAESVQKVSRGDKVYMSNRTPIHAGGQIIGAVAVLQDISELEAISSELEHTRQITMELDAIIESSFDGMYVTDGTGRTIRVNQAYERITGISRKDVLGRTMTDLVAAGFYNESVSLRVLESRKHESLIQKIKTGKTVMVTGTPIFDEGGAISLVVTNVRDVTELYSLQGELARMDRLRTQYENELEQLRGDGESKSSVVIRSKKMKEIHQLALRLSQVDTTLLVQGESGVGKEIFADLVHEHSPRAQKPFVKISCAAIPEQLLESELFGYAPGAFTGADQKGRAGLFEAADKGTIFLDEVGEMPLGLQAKLLRVLQEKQIMRVGSSEPIFVDVRIVAATNRDLKDMVDHGKFRKDLYFRLHVVPVMIPPLRERSEAISSLAYHFLDKYNRRYGFSKQMEPQVLATLNEYHWPGNVRELENTVERLVVVTQGNKISLEDVPKKLRKKMEPAFAPSLSKGSLKQTMEEVEREILARAFTTHKSTRKMARALGVNQSTVVRKLKRYGLGSDSI